MSTSGLNIWTTSADVKIFDLRARGYIDLDSLEYEVNKSYANARLFGYRMNPKTLLCNRVRAVYKTRMIYPNEEIPRDFSEQYVIENSDGRIAIICDDDLVVNVLKSKKSKQPINIIIDQSNNWKSSYKGGAYTSDVIKGLHIIDNYDIKLKKYKPRLTNIEDYVYECIISDYEDKRPSWFENVVSGWQIIHKQITNAQVYDNLTLEQLENTLCKINISGLSYIEVDMNTILAYKDFTEKVIIYTMQPGIRKK
jgi:hypothetical protein